MHPDLHEARPDACPESGRPLPAQGPGVGGSGGSPRSHLRQSSTVPSMLSRPSGVVTQGRLTQGGSWRTC